MKVKITGLLGFIFILFISCGLEDYYYLPAIPQSSVYVSDYSRSAVYIDSGVYSSYSYFYTFRIFYRIYISGHQAAGLINTTTEMATINSTLSSDFNAILPSTDTTSTTANTAIDSMFRNRRYFNMELQGADIDSVLSAIPSAIILEFPPNGIPSLEAGGSIYNLYRTSGDFTPKPDTGSPTDRLFLNTADLYDSDNANTTINADVANNAGIDPFPRYTYVSLYIAAVGFNVNTLTPLYSSPTFMGVLRIPESM